MDCSPGLWPRGRFKHHGFAGPGGEVHVPDRFVARSVPFVPCRRRRAVRHAFSAPIMFVPCFQWRVPRAVS
eukprot:720457-Alexandrium_andersonii.AAC.1